MYKSPVDGDEKKQRQHTDKTVVGLHMERYRSGHNEAVLKTVCPKGRVGSNPTLSAQNSVN